MSSSQCRLWRVAALLLLLAASVRSQESITPAEAAALAFPGCTIACEELPLSAAQRQAIAERAAVRELPDVVVRFVARQADTIEGMAYVDTRRVRSKAQQLLVVLDRQGKVRRIEILAWQEPQRFRPKAAFLAQFHGKGLDDTLRLRRGIRPVTGATLSARAAVDAVRAVLAAHELLPSPNRDDK